MNNTSQITLDFLRWRPLRTLALWWGFPIAVQAAALVTVVWLAVNAYGVGARMPTAELMTLRKTNLTTLVVWGLWWPLMIGLALVLGRLWCTICPIELVNRLGDVLARALGWPRARLGGFLRAGWMTVVLYLILQLLVAGFSIHRVPHYTAVFLFTLTSIALVAGLVFREGRSFCKAFCPASALLSVYGRSTALQLEARDLTVCEGCTTRDCVNAANRARFDRRSCPSHLIPYHRSPSDGCVLCLQCAKVCPHGNIGFGLVAADASVRRKLLLRPAEAAFVMIALGFVAHEVAGESARLEAAFHLVPSALARAVPLIPFAWIEALWFLGLFPAVVWAAIAATVYVGGHRADLRSLLIAAATGAAPIVAIAHLAKAAAKIASWAGFLPLALDDPRGIDTLHRLAGHTLAAPARILEVSSVGLSMLTASAVVVWLGWRWSNRMPVPAVAAVRVGLSTTALLLAAALAIWTWG